MIPTVRINKDLIVQKHLINGLKMYIKVNDKWYCFKLNEKDFEYLIFAINSIKELL